MLAKEVERCQCEDCNAHLGRCWWIFAELKHVDLLQHIAKPYHFTVSLYSIHCISVRDCFDDLCLSW